MGYEREAVIDALSYQSRPLWFCNKTAVNGGGAGDPNRFSPLRMGGIMVPEGAVKYTNIHD